jgi:hypothetical protein
LPAVLARYPHGMLALLGKAGIIDNPCHYRLLFLQLPGAPHYAP